MPIHKCGSSSLCLHELGSIKEDESGDYEYVEIDPSGRYGRYKEVLGKGASKTVYRAFDQEDGIEVAWNQVQDVLLQTPEDIDRLYSEVHLLSTLKHKNIIKLYHSWLDKQSNTVNFITEIFTSGTLRQYRRRHKHVDIKAVKNWSRQILRGLLYLHSHDPPIIHRDLKCDNIFINGNQGEVKIGDLGLAAILQHAHARSVIGTPEFMAPELYEEEYTELVDVYSFGMCILEMVTSEYPYSECNNAAQIYKKVTQGIKPEALKRVKDAEVCQFIEKCLAPVSKRLPARELLVDPFLQPEGTRGALESSPHLGRMIRIANGIDEKVGSAEEPHGISATVQISYVLKETLPAFAYDVNDGCVCSAWDSKSLQIGDYPKMSQSAEPIPLSYYKEDRARSVDFKVDGKLREDDNVFLKLQISGSEGQVRNIHFPFDVERDTAMCVASEMVAELDLTDQDVTKIAEMIDAAILALVPEWRPGVAIDETCGDGEDLENEGDDDIDGVYDPMPDVQSEGPILENQSYSIRDEPLSPSRIEGLVYGRFEEVTYQCHRSEFPSQEAEQCSDMTEISKDADCCLSDSVTSRDSEKSLPLNSRSVFEESSGLMDTKDSYHDNKHGGKVVFNDFIESKRKTLRANFVHKIFGGIVHVRDEEDNMVKVSLQTECYQQEDGQEISSKSSVAIAAADDGSNIGGGSGGGSGGDDDEVDDDEGNRELAELERRHEQEIKELQQKHEAARAEIRNRWRQKKKLKCDFPLTVCEHGKTGDISLENGFQSLKVDDHPYGLKRSFPYDYGSFDSSIWSSDDLSSFGQETPRSPCKTASFQEPRHSSTLFAVETVYFPSTAESM